MRNLQEQVEKPFRYQKLFWTFIVWINCSSDFANYWPSALNFIYFSWSLLEQFFLTVNQNNFGNRISFMWPYVIPKKTKNCIYYSVFSASIIHYFKTNKLHQINCKNFPTISAHIAFSTILCFYFILLCYNSYTIATQMGTRLPPQALRWYIMGWSQYWNTSLWEIVNRLLQNIFQPIVM